MDGERDGYRKMRHKKATVTALILLMGQVLNKYS